MIRARDKADLSRLLAKASEKPGFQWRDESVLRIHDWDYSDYRYRIYAVDEDDFAALFDALKATITYDNFKDEIHATPHQRKKYPSYCNLWQDIMTAHSNPPL